MIQDFEKIDNNYIYIDYKKKNHKFGDMELLHSAGTLGNSVLNFGLFYEEVEKKDSGAYFYLQSQINSEGKR